MFEKFSTQILDLILDNTTNEPIKPAATRLLATLLYNNHRRKEKDLFCNTLKTKLAKGKSAT